MQSTTRFKFRISWRLSAAALAAVCAASPAAAQVAAEPVVADASPLANDTWALHGQATHVTQWHPSFRAPYSGTNSLQPEHRSQETTDVTAYAGLRPWRGAELWLNPELDQGRGLDNTVGVAGFPSGEAYKIGANAPYLRLPRAFLRQTIDLGGDVAPVASAANQLSGSKSADGLTLTVGKFSVTDIFDTNTYAHDPRGDFLNWSVIDAGAFDYAADAWGFTYGAAAEWAQGSRTVRAGVFQLSKVPNGKITAVDFSQFMLVGEVEQRYQWGGASGKIKLLGFVDRGRMASYRDAVQLAATTGTTPDVVPVRRYASRPGGSVNIEHAFTAELGMFLRASVNDGSKEAYEFTEINRSLSTGVSVQGKAWGRPDDVLGIAGVINGLSGDARAYFAAGGIGILIGDGRLNAGAEKIVEVTYSARLNRRLALGLDYQHVDHPAYNRDRGPVSIYAVRLHSDF